MLWLLANMAQELKYVRCHLTRALYDELIRIAQIRHDRHIGLTVRYYLSVMMRVSQANPRLRLFPRVVDHSTFVVLRHNVAVSEPELAYIKELTVFYGIHQSTLVNRMVWKAIELHKDLDSSLAWRKEEELVTQLNWELQLQRSRPS